jgi:hypothetical protein
MYVLKEQEQVVTRQIIEAERFWSVEMKPRQDLLDTYLTYALD